MLVENNYQRLNTHQIAPVIPAVTRIASPCNFVIPMSLVLKKDCELWIDSKVKKRKHKNKKAENTVVIKY